MGPHFTTMIQERQITAPVIRDELMLHEEAEHISTNSMNIQIKVI